KDDTINALDASGGTVNVTAALTTNQLTVSSAAQVNIYRPAPPAPPGAATKRPFVYAESGKLSTEQLTAFGGTVTVDQSTFAVGSLGVNFTGGTPTISLVSDASEPGLMQLGGDVQDTSSAIA